MESFSLYVGKMTATFFPRHMLPPIHRQSGR
jgi:hypothetical protein